MRPCNSTSSKGFSPVNSRAMKIILATQKKMMSYPVTSTDVGCQASSSGVRSGQPMVEKVRGLS